MIITALLSSVTQPNELLNYPSYSTYSAIDDAAVSGSSQCENMALIRTFGCGEFGWVKIPL